MRIFLDKVTSVATLVAALLFSVLVAEMFVRVFVPVRPVLDVGKVEPWDKTYVLNSMGFREQEIPAQALGGTTTRILFLGDSFTFGQGVMREEDRFTDLLETRLNAGSTGMGRSFHIFNAGSPGTGPTQWLTYLDALNPVYRPDVVVVVFFLRDGTDLCTSLRCYETEIALLKDRYFFEEGPLARLRLWKLLAGRLVTRAFNAYYTAQIKGAYREGSPGSAWRQAQEALCGIRDLAAEHGVPCHLVIFPILFGLESSYPFNDVEREVERCADRAGIPRFSLTPGFLGHESSTLWVSPSDQHPNEKGHALAAEILYPYILKVVKETVAGTVEGPGPSPSR